MTKTRATDFGEEYDYCKHCKKELSEITKEIMNSSLELPCLSLNRSEDDKKRTKRSQKQSSGTFKIIYPAGTKTVSIEKTG